MDIYNQINHRGIDLFLNPLSLLTFEDLVLGTSIKGRKIAVLGSNTYRGFHRLNKSNHGAKYFFCKCLTENKGVVIKRLNETTSENDLISLENELDNKLRGLLIRNISEYQLSSFNKTRKPIDIIIEHLVAMMTELDSYKRKLIVHNLFLPLDSQMFQSQLVFSDNEIKELRLRRNFTFKDVKD